MISQTTAKVSVNFLTEINQGNQSEIITIADAQVGLNSIIPPYSNVVGAFLECSLLQANYYLPSLRKNPTPDISDLSSETRQTADIVAHKEKYNPLTGHAIEISFYKDFGSGGGWQKLSRDYLYNLGETEQYLPLLNPYFAASDSRVSLGKNEKLGARISLGTMGGESDYLRILASIEGEINLIYLADFPLQYNHLAGAVSGETYTVGEKKRNYLMISNYGPGRLYFAFGNITAANLRNTAWIEANNSLVFDGGNISYAGNSPQPEFVKGGVIPDAAIYLSSNTLANFGIIESFFT